jgi:methylmalonyl-CoA mutase cobalamin-binding subunit
MATRKQQTPEQVARKLAQADRMLGDGKDVAEVCRELGCRADLLLGGVISSAG